MSHSMEDWATNCGVQIGLEILILTKMGVCKISPPPEGRRQKHVFEHNSTPNYITKEYNHDHTEM